MSNLDARLRVEMRLELQKLQRDLGLTTIYVTHDQKEALALSKRIAVINHAQIVQQGEPRAIYEQPNSDFVAGLIGQANLISATIDRVLDSSHLVAIENGVTIEIPIPIRVMPFHPGEAVRLNVHA